MSSSSTLGLNLNGSAILACLVIVAVLGCVAYGIYRHIKK